MYILRNWLNTSEVVQILNSTEEFYTEFIFYNGNRWIVTEWDLLAIVEIFLPTFLNGVSDDGTADDDRFDDDTVDDDGFDDDGVYDDDFFDAYEDFESWPGFHSFWDGLVTDDFIYFSEPTRSGTPMGSLTWYQVLESSSVGDFGLYGASEEIKLEMHCSECSSDRGLDLCGLNGQCGESGTCQCRECYGGYYCEYGPDDLYAQEQVNLYDVYVQEGVGDAYAGLFLSNPDQCSITNGPTKRDLKIDKMMNSKRKRRLSNKIRHKNLKEKRKVSVRRNRRRKLSKRIKSRFQYDREL